MFHVVTMFLSVDAFGRVNLMMRESRRSRPGRALIQPLSVLAQATEDYDQNPFDADSHAHVEVSILFDFIVTYLLERDVAF